MQDYKGGETCPSLNPSLRRILSYIDQNYMRRLTLDDVAQQVYLTRTYICQLFSAHMGISFVSYLEQLRLSKAQELLQATDMSIPQIAEQVGYSTPGYFAKVFKKRTGMTPVQYRTTCDSTVSTKITTDPVVAQKRYYQ